MTSTLQQITDAYGNWVANSNPPSGGLWFSASTDYSRISNYSQYQVAVGTPVTAYGPVNLPATTSVTSAVVTENNASDVTQTPAVSLSEAITQAFNWSTTQALSVGITVTAGMTIPAVANVGGSGTSQETPRNASSCITPIATPTPSLQSPKTRTLRMSFSVSST